MRQQEGRNEVVAPTTWGADWDYFGAADHCCHTLCPCPCCLQEALIVTTMFHCDYVTCNHDWCVIVMHDVILKCQARFTPGWKSAEWTRRWVDLWNNLGFSLCAVLSVCRMVTTSDDKKKSEMRVSTDWYVAVEHWRSSSIRVIFVDYQTSEL